jgi:phosphoglycolate phosphatase-like HAD superfamily hydrolase
MKLSMPDRSLEAFVRSKTLIFWDFDGVIKESLDVKSRAFETLFMPYGAEIAERVRNHHESNGGLSRFIKIPLYLSWAGLPTSEVEVERFCARFSELVLQSVIDSPWVGGVRDYLERCHEHQYFVLLTATPKEEIKVIINRLGISSCFREVFGAPTEKSECIAGIIRQRDGARERMLVIGDSENDMKAARDNRIPFLLRRTPYNGSLQAAHRGPMFETLAS